MSESISRSRLNHFSSGQASDAAPNQPVSIMPPPDQLPRPKFHLDEQGVTWLSLPVAGPAGLRGVEGAPGWLLAGPPADLRLIVLPAAPLGEEEEESPLVDPWDASELAGAAGARVSASSEVSAKQPPLAVPKSVAWLAPPPAPPPEPEPAPFSVRNAKPPPPVSSNSGPGRKLPGLWKAAPPLTDSTAPPPPKAPPPKAADASAPHASHVAAVGVDSSDFVFESGSGDVDSEAGLILEL